MELGNPLSAVLHCAEDILDTVKTCESKIPHETKLQICEAADTIMLCVSHQKNIVDDILSFSKLDSSMLNLCPRSVQPKTQLANSLKMFQPEFRKQKINFEYKVDRTYRDLEVDWVKADLVRVSQVLVNLITNAIKFTAKKEGKKEVTVAVGASAERPTSYPPDIIFFDTEDFGYRIEGTNTSDWGDGEMLYIMVAVRDTGIGISDVSQKKLFQRFRQATPRTEEVYGGSGLGLNISRKLCQLHGGEIGVKSKDSEGSVFGFFFKVRRTTEPQGETTQAGDRLDSKKMEHHLENSEATPSTPVNDNDMPVSLEHPKYDQNQKTSLGAPSDRKRQHTAEIASHIKEGFPEAYDLMRRPSVARNASYRSENDANASPLGNAPDKSIVDAFPERRVLLVEDNHINQRILQRKLEAKGFSVVTANNGREAMDVLQTADNNAESPYTHSAIFDIILMDQEMPVMDGNTASRAIREWERGLAEQDGVKQHIPILGVTANVREEQRKSMRDAGMDDVIHKPYKIEEMVDRITSLLGPQR